MNNLKQITLSNGTVLYVREGMVTYTAPDQSQKELTRAQQIILCKLAHNLNCQVSSSELYEAYSGESVLTDDMGFRGNIAKMKNTLPKCIKESIKSVRGIGYKLEGTLIPPTEQHHVSLDKSDRPDKHKGKFADIAGDYYGFYLDPLGTGTVLGAYVHIENSSTLDGHDMTAYAILNIRNDEVLFRSDLPEIFTQSSQPYKDAFRKFKKSLIDNDRRCSWGQGHLSADGNLAVVTLATNDSGAKWTMIIDVTGYMRCRRDREHENDYYRGGLGLVLASRTIHGTFCFRLGLVRRAFINDSLSLNNEEMKHRLKTLDDSNEAVWKPLVLSEWLDNLWYDWFMND